MASSLNSAVSIGNAQSPLRFTQSIKYLVKICLLVGYNLREEPKHKIVDGILCAQALLASVFNLVYSYLKCELTSDDTQKLVASLEMITASISILLMNLQFRRSCRKLTTLMARLDHLLMQFRASEEQPLLDRLRRMRPGLITIVVSPMLIFYYHEYMTNERHVEFGSERFTRLSQRYHLRLIFNVWGRIPFSVTTLFLAIFICVILALNLLIASLMKKSGPTSDWSPLTHGTQCRIDFNDVMEFLNMHRQTAQLLRLADQIFGPFFLVGICLLVIQSITYARVLTLPDQPIALGPMAVLISGFVNITFVIMLCSKINEKLRQSLNHLMELGVQLQAYGKLTNKKAFALWSKIDLYVTHVELDPPALSMGGVMTMRPHLIVEIAGFILSYTVFVYSK